MNELYKDAKYCYNEIRTARDIFTSKKLFSEEKAELLLKGLIMMLVYCPEECKIAVEATIKELEIRRAYL
jgi:hypothetical protein